MFCVMMFFVLLFCVVAFSFMLPTQYSDFGGLLYRRYKSHMLFYYVLYCATLFCPVLSCPDGYTACKTVLRRECCVVSYSVFLCPIVSYFVFIKCSQHLSLCISKKDFDIIQFNILCFPVLFSRVLSYFPAYAD